VNFTESGDRMKEDLEEESLAEEEEDG